VGEDPSKSEMVQERNPVSEPNVIVNPRTGDKARAEDILGELCAVLRKYGYGLLFNPQRGVMALAKLDKGNARVIAEISRLLPEGAVWKEIDWTPKEFTKQ
jgi:hypothetical protein